MDTRQPPFLRFLIRHLAAILAIGLATVLLRFFTGSLEVELVALLYLLPVMISTALWGLTPGILAAFLAFLAFNYFFIVPYQTLIVHKTQDLITLIIFLVVAVVMSQLLGQAREGVRLAKSREYEATCLYELISALAGIQDIETLARVFADHVSSTFHLDWVEVSFRGDRENPPFTISVPEIPAQNDPPAPDETPLTRFPLRTARGAEGEICIRREAALTPAERRLLEAFTSQGALMAERIELTRGKNRARVLEESDRLKSSLLSSVSHELRSPLAAIKASVSSLRSGAVDWNTGVSRELLAMIEEETDHLNLLVGNLLDMSRIESGALNPNKRWNSIAEIAAGVVIKMRDHLHEHSLDMDFPENLPLVPTDYVMIEQVFTNLISNSVKYAPAGTRIAIGARREEDTIHVQVTNQGPQVATQDLERIFDKFYRVTAADQITGTGLGLSICKGVIEAHGGKIWAQNRPEGFEFHFTLPIKLNGALPDLPKEAENE
jgi:two-component system sensor histidine kinase KdpD